MTPFDAGEWEKIKVDVMIKAVRAKLEADPELKELLLATGDHPLLSIKNDTFWGFDSKKGGLNLLAEIWM